MQRHQAELQAAYVLHTRRFRETSLIAELLTSGQGRLGVVARGALSGKSASRAFLRPFLRLNVAWTGRGELGTLVAVEPAEALGTLGGKALACGFYVNELLMRLLVRHDPHPQLFEVYSATLKQLAAEADQAFALRIFEKRLLEELGYGLILDHDVRSGEPIRVDRCYSYCAEEGPVEVKGGESGSDRVSGLTLLALAQEQEMDLTQLKEAQRLLQRALGRYLGDKPLKSRELIGIYRRV